MYLLRKHTTFDQRQKKIIKYVEKLPLTTIRRIADNCDEKHSNYTVSKNDIEKLVKNKILFELENTKTYYSIPKNNEINTLVSIIKSNQFFQPKFKRLKFNFNEATFDRIMQNCIALIHLKIKILNIDVRRCKLNEEKEFKKLIRRFLIFLKCLPIKNKQSEKQYLTQLSNAFFNESEKDMVYFYGLIHNRKSSTETIAIIDQIEDEGKRSVSRKLNVTTKNIGMHLAKYTNSKDVFLFETMYDLADSEEGRNLVNSPTNSDITKVMFKKIGRKILLKIKNEKNRRKNAKILTTKFGIDFSKMDDLFDI